jgi:hypothetical protein
MFGRSHRRLCLSVGAHRSLRGSLFPTVVARQLHDAAAARGLSCPTWCTARELGPNRLRVDDSLPPERRLPVHVVIPGGPLEMYNLSSLTLSDTRSSGDAANGETALKVPTANDRMLRFAATGAILPAVVASAAWAAAQRYGFTSLYWITRDDADRLFATSIRPDAPPVCYTCPRSLQRKEIFNAQQTEHPERFVRELCTTFIARSLRGKQYPAELCARMRMHAILHGMLPIHTVWDSAARYEKLAVTVTPGAVPFVLMRDQQPCKYFPASSTSNPRKVLEMCLMSMESQYEK